MRDLPFREQIVPPEENRQVAVPFGEQAMSPQQVREFARQFGETPMCPDEDTGEVALPIRDTEMSPEETDEVVLPFGEHPGEAAGEDASNQQVMDMTMLALRQNSMPASIYMENSSDVHIGPRLHYNAPVTINQYVKVLKEGDGEGVGQEELAEHAVQAPSYVNGFASEKSRLPQALLQQPLHRRRRLLWGVVALIIVLVVIVAVTLHFALDTGPPPAYPNKGGPYFDFSTILPPADTPPDPNFTLSDGHSIIPRSFWSQYSPTYTRPLLHPTPYVVISHSAEPGCPDIISCVKTLRAIQAYHVTTFEQPDIGYNFIIDGEGNVYEGRGWDATNLHRNFVLRRNVGINFLDTPRDPNITLSDGHYIIPRSFWSQYPPKYIRPLPHPTPYVVISHSAEPGCSDIFNCVKTLRGIQAYHVATFEQPDIGYNFIIDGEGNVYEGRGWDATNFHQNFALRRNVGINFLGNYVYLELSEKQKKSLKDLLALGVRLGKLTKDYKLAAHSQTVATLSPGQNILKVIDSWPHRCLLDCVMPFNTTTTSTTTEISVTVSNSTNSSTESPPSTLDNPTTTWTILN